MLFRPWSGGRGRRPAGPFLINRESAHAAGLVAWLPLSQWSGTREMVGVIGTPAAVNGPAVIGAPGSHGSAHQFVGASTKYITLGNPSALQFTTGQYSISFWMMLALNSTDGMLVTKDKDTGGRAYTFDQQVGGNIRFYVNGGGGANVVTFTEPAVGVPTLVTGTMDNTALLLSLYQNGLLVPFGTATPGAATSASTANVQIGRREYAGFESPFTGNIWDVRFYSRLLSASEVWQLYDPATRWDLYAVPSSRTFFSVGAAAGAYSLSAVSGAYTVTGTAATLRAARNVSAAAGSYAETGTAATPRVGRKMSAVAGSYAATGTAATLTYTPAASARTLTADAGGYTIAGTTVTLRAARKVSAVAGNYADTGTATSFQLARKIQPLSGAYAWIGTAATLSTTGTVVLPCDSLVEQTSAETGDSVASQSLSLACDAAIAQVSDLTGDSVVSQ